MSSANPRGTRILTVALLAGAIALPLAAQGPAPGEPDGYGYFRTVEGEIRLTTFDQGEPIDVEPNYPVLTGDRVWVSPRARVEMVLPDRTVVRADSATDLYLESLALSADAEENASTAMNLVEGEILITVNDFFNELEPTVIETGHAAIYLQSAGTYRIRADNGVYTQVVVRDGFAEVHTERGSVVVRDGEEAELDGSGVPRVGLGTAASLSDLELWGQELDGVAYARGGATSRGGAGSYGGSGYVDPSLAYAAAPLASHGSWVSVSGRTAWRPHVSAGWQPYSNGWWVYTPSGLTWVSYEPFGWVTSHYGSWAHSPGWGWVWYPGATYSPAWVYWYWGPTHVAWVPVGYYTRHYLTGDTGFHRGFRFGVYGWAGGSWDYFSSWTFCPVRYFGRRGYHSYWRSGAEQRHHGGLRAVPRGVVTADTRPISPSRWGKPSEIVESLKQLPDRGRLRPTDLPDVTDFIARRDDLSPAVRERIFDYQEDRPVSRERGLADRRGLSPSSEAPWRPARPLPGVYGDADRMRDRFERDAEVSRGARIGDLRRSLSSVERGPGTTGRMPDRPAIGSVDSPRAALPGRELPERFRTGEDLVRPMMPPSGRLASPRGDLSPSGSGDDASGRLPVVRRILEGVRSGESGGGLREEIQRPTPQPRRDGDSSSVREGAADRRVVPDTSSSRRTPTTRSSPPPSRSDSARSGSSSSSRSRSESVRSSRSRSSDGAGARSSSRARSSRKKDGR